MALTKELITAQGALATLSEEQINALITLSTNDENTRFNTRFGEIHRELDEKIASALGVAHNGNEKTTDFLQRAVQEYTGKFADYDTIKASVAELTKEKARLEQQIAEGAVDKELKTKYDQLNAELTATKQSFNDLQAKFDKAENDHKAALIGLEIDRDLKAALATIKTKANMPEAAVKTLIDNAIAAVKAMHPEYMESEGKRTLIFRDENGAVMNNQENQLKPFTASELLSKQLKSLGILDEGRQQTGGGTSPTNPSTTTVTSLASAKSRVEADEIAMRILMEQGLTKGTQAFMEGLLKIRQDNADLYNTLK